MYPALPHSARGRPERMKHTGLKRHERIEYSTAPALYGAGGCFFIGIHRGDSPPGPKNTDTKNVDFSPARCVKKLTDTQKYDRVSARTII